MRRVGWVAFAVCCALTGATPAFAQHVHRSEPLVLPPYSVAFVQDSRCSAGQVMKVTGAIRGLRRKKTCVPLHVDQAFSGRIGPS